MPCALLQLHGRTHLAAGLDALHQLEQVEHLPLAHRLIASLAVLLEGCPDALLVERRTQTHAQT